MGVTILFQDVDEYSARDYGKSVRDMDVGMLPPKLAQIMLNISGEARGIYDPFVGLGTVLIEAAHGGYWALLGSDLAPEMVEASRENLQAYFGTSRTRVETFEVFEQDAKDIGSHPELGGWLSDMAIVTE
jgi:tRNA G10  N-methylase Trm11